jgi:hypothetical protein
VPYVLIVAKYSALLTVSWISAYELLHYSDNLLRREKKSCSLKELKRHCAQVIRTLDCAHNDECIIFLA